MDNWAECIVENKRIVWELPDEDREYSVRRFEFPIEDMATMTFTVADVTCSLQSVKDAKEEQARLGASKKWDL
jgi:hypothetical protein